MNAHFADLAREDVQKAVVSNGIMSDHFHYSVHIFQILNPPLLTFQVNLFMSMNAGIKFSEEHGTRLSGLELNILEKKWKGITFLDKTLTVN